MPTTRRRPTTARVPTALRGDVAAPSLTVRFRDAQGVDLFPPLDADGRYWTVESTDAWTRIIATEAEGKPITDAELEDLFLSVFLPSNPSLTKEALLRTYPRFPRNVRGGALASFFAFKMRGLSVSATEEPGAAASSRAG